MLCAGAFLPGPSLSSVLIFPFSFPTSTLDLPFLLGSLVPARPLHAVPSSPGNSLEPKRCRMVGLPRAAAQRRMRVGEPRGPGGGKPHYSGARRKRLRTLPRSRDPRPRGFSCGATARSVPAALHLRPGQDGGRSGEETVSCAQSGPRASARGCFAVGGQARLSDANGGDRSHLPSLGHDFQSLKTGVFTRCSPMPLLSCAS